MTASPIIRFTSEPPVGVTVWHQGQAYEIVGVEPYETRLGDVATLIRWRSNCADCGAPFEATSGRTLAAPNRRCPEHRSPGKRVRAIAGGKT